MAYKVIILYQLYMPSYFLGTFTEYPYLLVHQISDINSCWFSVDCYLLGVRVFDDTSKSDSEAVHALCLYQNLDVRTNIF